MQEGCSSAEQGSGRIALKKGVPRDFAEGQGRSM